MEKNRVSDQTLCSAFSPGGKFYVTGGTDKIVRVYEMSDPPLLVNELTGHTDRILTIQFNNNGQCCFATGSCDGTSIIWRYSSSQWTSIVLVASVDQQLISAASKFDNKTNQVTMICWERLTDSYLATGHTPDCNIRIWNTSNGEMVSLLKGHTNEVFVVECHPKEPRILLTAGHDGQVIIWDMLAAVQLKVFQIEHPDADTLYSDDDLYTTECILQERQGKQPLLRKSTSSK
ncbi:PREDICTED: bromodomain and WD repeat-containing protein 3-like [Amphimedon queenslandica]|uniref:Uncharacterized protein n=2 Tax=Amphimedon queenslandica TaxID=400682 RepID=A0AAN0JUY0_AMPQE|nr:PREDICTED: bromodomain and WD repeat-containing protein 3-like [Amphimedon queenslandica]|eukprot:XP_019860715.1 PREDICTED: bromodomain and WD repeat-containing protein 3-like [Amphimedon queenslandica]